jgi:hypothetical protein
MTLQDGSFGPRRSYLQHFLFASIADVGADSDWGCCGSKSDHLPHQTAESPRYRAARLFDSYREQFIGWRLL